MIAAAARVSYKNDMKNYSAERNGKLIKYLLEHNHGTPLEHTLLTYRVKAPLPITTQMLRHRVGVSPNLESHRYKAPDFHVYIPMKYRVQAKSNRQASVEGEVADNEGMRQVARNAADVAIEAYHTLIADGASREEARFVLPHGTYTSGYFTFNVRSLLHFLGLRDKPDAQWQIQQYAKAFHKLALPHFPQTMAIYEDLHEGK